MNLLQQAGAEHLRTLQNENKKSQTSSDDFHSELLRLRQNWRLKKVRMKGMKKIRIARISLLFSRNFDSCHMNMIGWWLIKKRRKAFNLH